ncbi:MAG TPA: nitronate monooxygenase [Gaiellaceae bacterium]|nr:nitronate monooxygenase [Gaiellaceae bacterium]
MLLDELRHPIVLAPLAGGPSTPALAAAVCEAGGLGFLASGYLAADRMREEIHALRELTAAPLGVNVFAPGEPDVDEQAVQRYVERLRATEGAEVGEPRFDDDDWNAKLEALAEEPADVVSFTFGCPSRAVISRLQGAGSEVWVTVTSPEEARLAESAGADALVLQGIEAGGHRASFVDTDDGAGIGLLALLRLVASRSRLPLVATGGIADGAGVAAVLAAGAAAAQLGTAFMRAPEAGTHPAHKAALKASTPTALTRAFTGRLARGLVNRFLVEHSAGAPTAYPHIHHATAPLRAAARKREDADGFNLWAGQAHELAEERPAAEIVEKISSEARAALARASTS